MIHRLVSPINNPVTRDSELFGSTTFMRSSPTYEVDARIAAVYSDTSVVNAFARRRVGHSRGAAPDSEPIGEKDGRQKGGPA